jgi:hypothetical protein
MYVKHWCLAIALCTLVGSAAAQVTATIRDVPGVSPYDAFDFKQMTAYHPAVIYTNDIYALYYHGGGPSNTGSGFNWNQDPCNNTAPYVQDPNNPTGFIQAWVEPDSGYSECDDRTFFAWKHLSCAAGGACGSTNSWNVWPGTANYPALQYFNSKYTYSGLLQTGITPPTSIANWSTGNSLSPLSPNFLPYQTPALSYPDPATPSYSVPSYSGGGNQSAIEVEGHFFMAWDPNINDPTHHTGGNDVHRIAWAYSNDGANWTQSGVVIRDASEVTNRGEGVVASALYYEQATQTFYMLASSLKTGQIYLLKAHYSPNPPYFDHWYVPTGSPTFSYTTYIDPNTPFDFTTATPLFTNISSYYTTGTMAKVYANSTNTVDYNYVFVVDEVSDGSYPLRVYTSPTLEHVQTTYATVNASGNTSHATARGEYSWYPNIPWMGPDSTYTRAYNPVTLWLTYTDAAITVNCLSWDTQRIPCVSQNDLGRVQLVLSGGIY